MSNSGVNRVSQVEVLARPGERLLPSDPTYLESLTIGPCPPPLAPGPACRGRARPAAVLAAISSANRRPTGFGPVWPSCRGCCVAFWKTVLGYVSRPARSRLRKERAGGSLTGAPGVGGSEGGEHSSKALVDGADRLRPTRRAADTA